MNKEKNKHNTKKRSPQRPVKAANLYHVLLAEDDLEMRRMLAWSLCEKGYEVTECDDGYCLMKRLGFLEPFGKTQNFDLIISDIRMPGVTGMQVLESAKEFEDFPPMILITAFGDDNTHTQARKLGAAAMLDKPFDVADLLAKVAQVVRPQLPSKKQQRLLARDKKQTAQFPVDIVFRHDCGSEPVRAFVQKMAGKLNRFNRLIQRCHVVIDQSDPDEHQKHRYLVSITLNCPGKTIVAKHNSDKGNSHENLYLAIRIAFGTLYRQVKTYHKKHNRNKELSHF
jgi:CheY-like chemotaxis protein/ribosome-associated translation inhibitor RaiA